MSQALASVLHRMVFEVRYNYGFTYLDRCGVTLNALLRAYPGWTVDDANVQGTVLRCPNVGAAFAFNSQKLDLNVQQSQAVAQVMPISDFAHLSSEMAAAVIEGVGIDDITRIGFRVWRLFGQADRKSAVERMRHVGIVSSEAIEAIAHAPIEDVSFSAVVDLGEFQARLAVASVEQSIEVDATTLERAAKQPRDLPRDQRKALLDRLKAEKAVKSFPHHAVLVDVDAYAEYPVDNDRERFREFISDAFTRGGDLAQAVMAKQLDGPRG
jgi:hypothetical protein